MKRWGVVVVVVAVAVLGAPAAQATESSAAPPAVHGDPGSHASGFQFFKYPDGQPTCAVDTTVAQLPLNGLLNSVGGPYAYKRGDCGWVSFDLFFVGKPRAVQAALYRPGTRERFATLPVTYNANTGTGRLALKPAPSWPAGVIAFDLFVQGEKDAIGSERFGVNLLGAKVLPATTPAGTYTPGQPVRVSGTLFELDSGRVAVDERGVPGTLRLQVRTPDGHVRGPYERVAAGNNGAFAVDLPSAATKDLTGVPERDFRLDVAVEAVDAGYGDPLSGAWLADTAGRSSIPVRSIPRRLVLENRFVSAKGWVKPGESYPFSVFVKNHTSKAASNVRVRLPAVDGAVFTIARPSAGRAAIGSDGAISWAMDDLAAGSGTGPTIASLVVEARANTTVRDPRIVWKDLSAAARLTSDGEAEAITARSRGPKVIPPDERYDTARYGDRPFPIVPVDFADRHHDPSNSGDRLEAVVNSPDVAGSTHNLYNEMSYGQLSPKGFVPSAGIESRGFAPDTPAFTAPKPNGTCHGVTLAPVAKQLPERIHGGWYQLPGTTDYYGDDRTGSALVGRLGGVNLLGDTDSACGPPGKLAYDAAAAADAELNLSDYDTDKDGVVDFFMVVYPGLGGNGASQLDATPPYDNVWPHSSNLEAYYTDPATGLAGYVSHQQDKDLEGRPLYYTNAGRQTMTTDTTDFPVFVRIGPYNVNPESAVSHASVIAHEYGHSLGLPDFYATDGRQVYGDWTLMSEDKSQNMDVFSKQELGWLVPRVLPPGDSVVRDWKDSKFNTHRIDWAQPDGTPYTLSGPDVNNGQAYVARLPARQLLDPAKLRAGASPTHLWWSQQGNDFGCPAIGGHNLDVALPELATLAKGTNVTLSFKSLWDAEWDFDYGFVLVSTDGGQTYRSLASKNNYTTPQALNPNQSTCQQKFGNGITGSSGSYAAHTETTDRLTTASPVGSGYPSPVFVADSYDLSSLAGSNVVLRFSYTTDAAVSRLGWFIDDVRVAAGDRTIYSSDFEHGRDDPRLFNGGCQGTRQVAGTCTKGWAYVDATKGSPADHAYYLEMRDRSGFDFDGHGQNDRSSISWLPGLSLDYTDENHGYGNVGVSDPPAQSPLDSQPQPGLGTPKLENAAFTADGNGAFTDHGIGHTDNYTDPSSRDGLWHFQYDCLTFGVQRMEGDGIGPETSPGDLKADVQFHMGPGCATFDYGYHAEPRAFERAGPLPKPEQSALGDMSPALLLLVAAAGAAHKRRRPRRR